MFKQGDEVYIKGRKGLWVVKDADERYNNGMMLVHLQADSGFVLLAVAGHKCNLINEEGK